MITTRQPSPAGGALAGENWVSITLVVGGSAVTPRGSLPVCCWAPSAKYGSMDVTVERVAKLQEKPAPPQGLLEPGRQL